MKISKFNETLKKLYFLKAIGYKFVGSNFINSGGFSGFTSLDELNLQIGSCALCALRKSANRALIGSGDISSGVMLLSLAPSISEDQSGEHLSGMIGTRLQELIFNALGLRREQIYVSSVLRCKADERAISNSQCFELCRPYLFEEIALVRPKVIIALGERVFLNLYPQSLQTRSFDSVRGSIFRLDDSFVVPTFSGEKLVKNPSFEEIFLRDLSKIRGLI